MKVYKISDVAEILQVCDTTVKNEIRRNKLKAHKVGTDWRIPEQFLHDYLGVIANDGLTEKEAQLTKENAKLKNKILRLEGVINSIKSDLIAAVDLSSSEMTTN
ncbi:helix-turn-helix domain-containing protein [Clostridium sp. 19966]|uniref:helix-turn-helix domain-containing protein n=1 Tax=Clostridium sp. 19966 TaxID=2768166 RepID=UPI0028DFF3B6|nr:helix-turn-helix domain-containing protein [Clostridium sp. 19966]MDT8717629.1 helix-turn-helix domain-containing protein [Clostridium sp. 19966]